MLEMVKVSELWMDRVVNATVRILSENDKGEFVPDGQGVLVPGGLVLTAAHCIGWTATGMMTLDSSNALVAVQPRDHGKFSLTPSALEPVADIAALDEPDNQEFSDDFDAFEEWRESTKPVPISVQDFPLRQPVPVHILAHTGEWIRGTVTKFGLDDRPRGRICIEAERQIHGGTSGGPVVDEAGALVGLVSHISIGTAGGACTGMIPLVRNALPGWIWKAIADASR